MTVRLLSKPSPGIEPAAHLRRAIIKTLLMGTIRVRSIHSDVDDITISKEPFLYGQVVDNTGQPIRLGRSREQLRGLSVENRLKSRSNGLRIIYSVTINMVPNHLINVRINISVWSAVRHANMALMSR